MRYLGFDRFAVVGHDRGAYTAFRAALDHPGAISHLAILDAVPDPRDAATGRPFEGKSRSAGRRGSNSRIGAPAKIKRIIEAAEPSRPAAISRSGRVA